MVEGGGLDRVNIGPPRNGGPSPPARMGENEGASEPCHDWVWFRHDSITHSTRHTQKEKKKAQQGKTVWALQKGPTHAKQGERKNRPSPGLKIEQKKEKKRKGPDPCVETHTSRTSSVSGALPLNPHRGPPCAPKPGRIVPGPRLADRSARPPY